MCQIIHLLSVFLLVFSPSVVCMEISSPALSSSEIEPKNNEDVPAKVSNVQNISYTKKNDTEPIIVPDNMHRNMVANLQAQKVNEKFRPSVHLGDIKEPCLHQLRKSQPTPFNHVGHVQFDNTVNTEPDKGTVLLNPQQSTTNPVKFTYDTDSRYVATPTIQHHALHNPYQHGYQEGYTSIDTTPQVPHHVPQVSHISPILPTSHLHYELEKPSYYHNHHYAAEVPQASIYQNPIKYDGVEPVHYQYSYITPVQHDDVTGNYEPPSSSYNSYYVPSNQHDVSGYYDGDVIKKPGSVVYVTSHRQTSVTKTRKFPYKFFQPVHDVPGSVVEHGHAFVPEHKPVSPWHKILHLIGAFLPLGLLIAALKPPIIKIDGNNTVRPDVVLSKLRPVNLPLEHRSLEESDKYTCEDKTICETILLGANDNADFVHKLIFDFSNRWTENEARINGLEDLYKAVKKKNCNFIKC